MDAESTTNACIDPQNETIETPKIHFEVASRGVQEQSRPILEALARLLDDHPEIGKLEVAAHVMETSGSKY
jgi:hypothetical protein